MSGFYQFGEEGREGTRTRSRFIVSIALSMPLTTLVMFPVTCRIVVAVSTRLATASMRLARRSRFSDSLFLRIALEAYIRAPSLFPCWSACSIRYVRSCSRSVSLGGREEAGGCRWEKAARTFFSRVFSAFSSFCAFFAWRFSDFAVNCGEACQVRAEGALLVGTLSWNNVSENHKVSSLRCKTITHSRDCSWCGYQNKGQ